MSRGSLSKFLLVPILGMVGCQDSAINKREVSTLPHQKPLPWRSVIEKEASTCQAFSLLKGSYYLAFRLNSLKKSRHLGYYIDIDKNKMTGYVEERVPESGADFLLEDGVLFHYTGREGSHQWSWEIVAEIDNGEDIIEKIGDTLYVKYPDLIDKNPLVYAVGFDKEWEFEHFYGYCANTIEDHGGNYLKEDYQKLYNLNSTDYQLFKTDNSLAFELRVEQTFPHLAYYIDVDHNNTTGYFDQTYSKSGAEYMLEDGVLFHYLGKDGSHQWSWEIIAEIDDNTIEEVGQILYVNYPDLLEKSPLVYAVAMDHNWETQHFYGYYDLKNPLKEKNLGNNIYGTWKMAEDKESYYLRFVFNDETILTPPLASLFNYTFTSNGLQYHTKGDLLFQQDELFNKKLLYTIRQSDSLTIIQKRKFPDIQEITPVAFEMQEENGEVITQSLIQKDNPTIERISPWRGGLQKTFDIKYQKKTSYLQRK